MILGERVYVWLGAEGVSEAPVGWTREADGDETVAVHAAKTDAPPARTCSLDGIGRPYWLVEVLPTVPEPIRKLAGERVRMLRLEV